MVARNHEPAEQAAIGSGRLHGLPVFPNGLELAELAVTLLARGLHRVDRATEPADPNRRNRPAA